MPDLVEDYVACRICMDSKHSYVSIFSQDLSAKVMVLADVQVEKNDGLPESICSECEHDLEKCYEFRIKVQTSDKKFRENMSQVDIEECNIKEESYMDEIASDNVDDKDSDRKEDDRYDDVPETLQKAPEETREAVPDPLNHVVVVGETERMCEMSKESLNKHDTMIDESQVLEMEEVAFDSLECMKEEAEAMDVDSNQRDPLGSSSMPRVSLSPKPASKRQIWDKNKMKEAVSAVILKKMGVKKASKHFEVPKTTLRRYIKEASSSQAAEVPTKKLGRKPALPEALETELVEYLLYLEAKFYGFTLLDVRRMAYQLAVRNGNQTKFRNEIASRTWVNNFLRCHQELSIRKPTSYARAKGFTCERVNAFYDLLELEYSKHNYLGDRIWNVDETGFSVDHTKIPQVISNKGKCQSCSMPAAECGSLVTVICSMSAGGSYVPPMLIFPRTNMSDLLMRGAPPGSIGRAHPSGWVQANLFRDWLAHFIDKTKPTETSPILLILDGHFSHTINIDVIDLARNNYITILSLPSHTTHKLQPLDQSFMRDLKTHYGENIRQWMLHETRPVGPYDIAYLVGKAYLQCSTRINAVNGFRVTGIYPLKRNIFQDHEFLAGEEEKQDENQRNNLDNQPHKTQTVEASPRPPKLTFTVSPRDIQPVPEKKERSNCGRKPSIANSVTSSPYKRELENYIAKKEAAASHRGRGRGVTPSVNRGLFDNSQPSCSGLQACATKQVTMSDSSQHINIRKSKKIRQPRAESSDNDNEMQLSTGSDDSPFDLPVGEPQPNQEDASCLFCDEKFSSNTHGESWVQCLMCTLWAHNECAGAGKEDYVCEFCR